MHSVSGTGGPRYRDVTWLVSPVQDAPNLVLIMGKDEWSSAVMAGSWVVLGDSFLEHRLEVVAKAPN